MPVDMVDECAPIPVEVVRDDIQHAIENARELAKAINRGEGGREVALAITKLEEALLWLTKVK